MYILSSIQFCNLCRLLNVPPQSDTEQFLHHKAPLCCPFITTLTHLLPPPLITPDKLNLSTISKMLSFQTTLIQFLKQQLIAPLDVKAQYHCPPARKLNTWNHQATLGAKENCPIAQNLINQRPHSRNKILNLRSL